MFQELLDVSTAFLGSFSSVDLLNLIPSDEQISVVLETKTGGGDAVCLLLCITAHCLLDSREKKF
jgi:hypothetical protein